MPTEVHPGQYALFEDIIRQLDGYVEYKAMVPIEHNGTTRTVPRTLYVEDKNQLPWGTLDAIISVKWYPAGKPDFAIDAERRHLEFIYSYADGIHVLSDLMEVNDDLPGRYRSHAETLGLKGVIKRLANCVEFDSLEAVRQRIQEIIDRATEVLDEEKRIQRDHAEYDDMADRYDFDYHVERGIYEY